MTSGGLPHSGTRGSTPADGSPRLFAAFRALHRPSTPRHPPCARRSSAAMLAHDAEPTGSTHVHHSALVKDPRPSRASSEPSTATTAPDASHEPRTQPTKLDSTKNGPLSGRITRTRASRSPYTSLFSSTITSVRIALLHIPAVRAEPLIVLPTDRSVSRARTLAIRATSVLEPLQPPDSRRTARAPCPRRSISISTPIPRPSRV